MQFAPTASSRGGQQQRTQRMRESSYCYTPVKPDVSCIAAQNATKKSLPEEARVGEDLVFRYRIVGIENSAPSLMPEGQREVMVLVLVQNLIESGPCWLRSPKDEDFQPPKE